MAKAKFDVYQAVTDRIIKFLEDGNTPPWVKPWRTNRVPGLYGGMPYNADSKRAYSGVNVILLWMTAMELGYQHTGWLTFKQAKKLGGSVRKGEKSTMVVFYSTITKTEQDADGNDVDREIGFLKAYNVFNVEQCEGLPEKITGKVLAPEELDIEGNDNEAFDAWIAGTGAIVKHGYEQACYVPAIDVVRMPDRSRFLSAAEYDSTAAHELVHWTGAKHRLNRDKALERKDPKGEYAFEELVAELGASFICAEQEIDHAVDQSAAYVKSWLKALKNDKRFIVQAASQATKAVKFLNEKVEGAEHAEAA